MSLLSRLDPRLHLAAAIGWTVFGIIALAALVAANFAAAEAERRARDDTERLLMQFTVQMRNALTTSLITRRAIVQVTAAQIAASGDRGRDALQRHLDAVQAQFPEFVWLGVTDPQGRVLAATGDISQDVSVAGQTWFQQGRLRPYLGEVRETGLLDAARPSAHPSSRDSAGAPLRYIEAAAPIVLAQGHPAGVLGAALSWNWVERLQTTLLRALDTQRQLEVLLVAEDGTVLTGPPLWRGGKLDAGADLTQRGAYVVNRLSLHTDQRAGWTVILRQDAESALGSARSTHHTVFLGVLLAGLGAAVAAVAMTHRLTRRLAELAEKARAVQRGERRTLSPPAGADEVSRIGATLAQTIDQLQQEKQALTTLNAELDARVAERSARIERMAEEARHAAVTRDRLRLARDLHDTLAHSLMALLTQIRLVRKLHARLDPGELDAELGRAEGVAASGLSEARAAITQIRYNGVRDIGLGSALRELLDRFAERTGIAATWLADPPAAGLDGERGEMVFRIVEEALHNVERHAQATQVRVTMRVQNGLTSDARTATRWQLEIADDGVGFDLSVARPGHYGLRGMQEQAALIDAQLDIHSRPGEGVRIVLEFDA